MDEDTVILTPQLNFLTNSIRGSGTWIIQRRTYPSRQLLVTRSIFLSLPFSSPSLSPRLCAFLSNICNMKGFFLSLSGLGFFLGVYLNRDKTHFRRFQSTSKHSRWGGMSYLRVGLFACHTVDGVV